jgi:hypothetical protein
MAIKQVDAWLKMLVPAQLLNSSPALGLRCRANRGMSHAGLIEKPEVRRGNANTDVKKVRHSGVDMHE